LSKPSGDGIRQELAQHFWHYAPKVMKNFFM